MKIETKYSVGDTVFYEEYGTIKEGKIVDICISSNKSTSSIIYEVNIKATYLKIFNLPWPKPGRTFEEKDLYSFISEVADKMINQIQFEIDIKNEKIRKIR